MFGTTTKGLRRAAAPLLLATGVTLAGCMQTPNDFTAAEAEKRIEVRWITQAHAVGFTHDAAVLSPAEELSLEAFVRSLDLFASTELMIDPGGPLDPLARARADAVAAVLARYAPHLTPATRRVGLPGESDGVIRVVAGRYLAVAPRCPNFSGESSQDFNNMTASNFGCATAVNLATMVADPGDLVRARRVSPADTAAAVAAIERYRAGEIKPPVAEGTLGE